MGPEHTSSPCPAPPRALSLLNNFAFLHTTFKIPPHTHKKISTITRPEGEYHISKIVLNSTLRWIGIKAHCFKKKGGASKLSPNPNDSLTSHNLPLFFPESGNLTVEPFKNYVGGTNLALVILKVNKLFLLST